MSRGAAANRPSQRFRTGRVISALILREMATTYGRSLFGYTWAILEPVAAVTVLTIVMSFAFSSPPIGTSFALFYATGYLPFMLYMDISNKLSVALRFSKPLLAYPRVTFADAIFARFLLNVLTHLVIFSIFMIGLRTVLDIHDAIDFSAIMIALSLAALLGLGVGSLNCVITSLFPSWERIWSILNRPLFLISTILFIFEDIPDRFQAILWYNPIVHFVGLTRIGFYPTYGGNYISISYVVVFALVILVFGLLLLRKFHQKIMRDT